MDKITQKDFNEFLEICKKIDIFNYKRNIHEKYYLMYHRLFVSNIFTDFELFVKSVLEVNKSPIKFFLYHKESFITDYRKNLLQDLIKMKYKV